MPKQSLRQLRELLDLYTIPTVRGKETTSKDYLEYIKDKTSDPILASVLEVRSLTKMITNDLPNWTPKPDGRVHPFFHFSPPQGQIASRSPNTQNASKHTEVGQEFRGIIRCPPGYTFVEGDFRRFHVHTMAYLAGDKDYLRFAQLDSHSIFCSHVMNFNPISMKWGNGDIKLAAKETKKRFPVERQGMAKPVVLGNQLGLGRRKLYQQNRKYIASEIKAGELQDIITEMFPRVSKTKDAIRRQAQDQGYLVDPWGRPDYFHDVLHWRWNKVKNMWVDSPGGDSEKVLAHMVQGTAFGMKYEKSLELERIGANEEYNFINDMHDALNFIVEDEKVDRCIETLVRVMGSPCAKLKHEICPEGLQVGVDVSLGKNWQKWDNDKNPEGMREIEI